MKLLMISCSKNAYALAEKLERLLIKEPDYEIISGVKCEALPNISMSESIGEFVEKWFCRVDAILFFSATGIAVRCIAPCLTHKSRDPGVMVMDEQGKYCISLLSGHIGGANFLTEKIARLMGAVPIITTATDVENKFAVDEFAREHNLTIENWGLAKKVSVAILEEKPVGFLSFRSRSRESFPFLDDLEEALIKRAKGMVEPEAEINISFDYKKEASHTTNCLCLIPKVLILGIGCKKDVSFEQIQQAVKLCFEENRLYESAVYKVASIDLKKDEPGLNRFCEERNLLFITFSPEVLSKVEGEFEASAFVETVTGVDNVCERSAMAACTGKKGRLLIKKWVWQGVTLAVALDENRDSGKK